MLSKTRQHLSGFLLRHGKIYSGVRTWTQAYRRWLTTVRFDHPGQQVVLQDYIDAVITAEQRVARLTRQITELMPAWSMAPVETAIQAMRGVALINAVTIVAEVGDFARFGNTERDPPTSESSVPNPAENAASSPAVPAPTVNENGATARNPAAKDTPNYEHTARPSTDKTPDLSWKHIRLSLRSPMSFPKR